MSEELTKLIDKTIGKKGRLRVPAYWMHKVLSGIVGYVKEHVEKLEKSLASTSKELSGEIATVKAGLPEVIIHEGDIVSGDALEPTPFKKDCYLDILPSGCSFQYTERGVAEEYTVYAFMNPDSSFMGITVGHFGFYRINIFRHLNLQTSTDIVEQKHTAGTGLAYATYVTTSNSNTESISLTKIRTCIYNGKFIGSSSHTPGTAGEHSYIVIFDDYTNSETFKGNTKLVKIELGSQEYIQNSMFSNCSSLKEIVIPEGVTSIGTQAFQSCSSLTEIVIPEGVTSIGDRVFYGCTNLQTLDFSTHAAIPSLGTYVFYGAASDFKIIVPDALYDDWIVASNWSTYADHIVKASEYVETE